MTLETSLPDPFAQARQMQAEIISGEDNGEKWAIRRYEFELRSTELGGWIAHIVDWKRIQMCDMATFQPGDEIEIGHSNDPVDAFRQALSKILES